MRHSESFAQIAAALAAANAEFPPIEKNRNVEVVMRNGGSYWFSYATLDAILNAIRVPLAKNGLALMQAEVAQEVNVYGDAGVIVDVERELMMETRLIHSSGEWISNTTPILIADGENSAQAHGGGVSYARRYGVTTLVCLASEEDDDGNSADGNSVTQAKAKGARRSAGPGGPVISDKQLGLLRFKLKDAGGNEPAACAHFGVESLTALPRSRMDEAMKAIADKHPALLVAPSGDEAKAQASGSGNDAAKAAHLAMVAKNGESLNLIRYHLGVVRNAEIDALESEYDDRNAARAGQEWLEYNDEEQATLWLAPTKGGWFTTAEREALRAAVNAYRASQKKD